MGALKKTCAPMLLIKTELYSLPLPPQRMSLDVNWIKKQKSGFSHSKWEKPNKRKKRNYKGVGGKKEVVKKCKMRWEQL